MSTAPWTPQQVDALNAYQKAGRMHPFTCPNRSDPGHERDPEWGRGDKGVLRATELGWVCLGCNYAQDWAHDFMERPMPQGIERLAGLVQLSPRKDSKINGR